MKSNRQTLAPQGPDHSAPLFSPTGDPYALVSIRITTLPRSEQNAADRVWKAIFRHTRFDRTELRITDKMLARSPWLDGFSPRFVRKGLTSLERLGLIERTRRRGLRSIAVLGQLRSHKTPAAPPAVPKAAPEPPAARPVEKTEPVKDPAEMEQIHRWYEEYRKSRCL